MENGIPEWAQAFCEEILDCFEDLSPFEARYAKPKDNEYESHLFEIAPVLMEIDQPNENDGEEVFSQNFHVDLLAIQKVFSRINVFDFGFDSNQQAQIVIEGKKARRDIVVLIHTVPFDDADISGRIGSGGSIEFFE